MAKRVIWAKEAVSDRIQILDYWYKRLGSKEYPAKLDEMFKETIKRYLAVVRLPVEIALLPFQTLLTGDRRPKTEKTTQSMNMNTH